MAELERCWLVQRIFELVLFSDFLVLPIQRQKMPDDIFGSMTLAQIAFNKEWYLSSDTETNCYEQVLLKKLVGSRKLKVVLEIVQFFVQELCQGGLLGGRGGRGLDLIR